jgi:hypothetical protein
MMAKAPSISSGEEASTEKLSNPKIRAACCDASHCEFTWVEQDGNAFGSRDCRFEQLYQLGRGVLSQARKPSDDVAAWISEAADEPGTDRIWSTPMTWKAPRQDALTRRSD